MLNGLVKSGNTFFHNEIMSFLTAFDPTFVQEVFDDHYIDENGFLELPEFMSSFVVSNSYPVGPLC